MLKIIEEKNCTSFVLQCQELFLRIFYEAVFVGACEKTVKVLYCDLRSSIIKSLTGALLLHRKNCTCSVLLYKELHL